MPRFAANLSMLYNELPFVDRFEAAARDGFAAVEYLFPYDHPAEQLAAQLQAHGLTQVLFNAPPGNWQAGERGMACLPGRETEFQNSVHLAMRYAQVLDCPRIHVLAGIAPPNADQQQLQDTYLQNLAWAAQTAAAEGREVLIEPINPRDMPGYFLNRQDHAHQLVTTVGSPHLKVQMDLYHCQIVEGDVATKLRHYLPTGRVGHIQIAGVPERHEPGVGELNFGYLLEVIDSLSGPGGWNGWVGCEYRPARGAVPGGTTAGLGWRPQP